MSTTSVPILTGLSVNGHSRYLLIPRDGAANCANYFIYLCIYPCGPGNALTAEQEIQHMAPAKLPANVFLMVELVSWVAIVVVMGVILTLIGGSIYTSLVITN